MTIDLYSLIAREELGIETLAVRGLDSLDFHDVYVGAIHKALDRAFQAGLREGMTKAHTTTDNREPDR